MTGTVQKLKVEPVTVAGFAPFGQLIRPAADGKGFDQDDAQLVLTAGTPRFYLMTLERRGRQFDRITRHQRCTQCLGSLQGQPWLIGVAPPGASASPDPSQIRGFQIPGDCFIKLAVGTWHAGPYFDAAAVTFYNLELSDTNQVDHHTCNLRSQFGLAFELVD